MATDSNMRAAPWAVVQYDLVLEIPDRSDAALPALMLRLTENRSGGWRGTVRVNPRLPGAEDALQVLMRDGLVPGSAVLVKLLIGGSRGLAGTAVRTWPSVVTSVATEGSEDVNEPDAVCLVTLRDPLTYLGDRPVWAAFVECPLGRMLGGALSCAAGHDGRPTRNPILPGLPTVRIHEELRDEVADVGYAIAAGEPLRHWLDRVFSRLGVRIEMIGDVDGTLHMTVCDRVPSGTGVNSDGGLDMTMDPNREPGATNLVLSEVDVNAPAIVRGGLLDDVAGDGPQRFGPGGALETVLIERQPNADEAVRRAGFRQANRRLKQTRATFSSGQPGLTPGRVVNLKPSGPVAQRSHPLAYGPPPGAATPSGVAVQGPPTALLGARRWQVADVAHLCERARYWNQASFEKTGLAWRPEPPRERGAMVVSGVVDDGTSAQGELVGRDRLGRVPIRLSFIPEASDSSSAQSPDDPAPALVPLSPVAPGAGDRHGFVSDHRQGDWCRVSVINPLFAEIMGYSHRDDRQLGENVRDATAGIVVREDLGEWHGMLFRPHADEDDAGAGDDSPDGGAGT